ncbi:MAG: YcfL family protein [Verrucomicrobia bacterium]|nr:YcfL family protein [Verrucomicrobiota bacterium]
MPNTIQTLKLCSVAILSGVAALIFSGCQAPGNPNAGLPGEVNIQSLPNAGIEITGILNADGSLNLSPQVGQRMGRGDFIVDNIRAAYTDSGFPRVEASLSSISRGRISIQYRFAWFDANGMEIAAGTGGWNTLSLAARETATIQGVARSQDAVQFRILARTFTPGR